MALSRAKTSKEAGKNPSHQSEATKQYGTVPVEKKAVAKNPSSFFAYSCGMPYPVSPLVVNPVATRKPLSKNQI